MYKDKKDGRFDDLQLLFYDKFWFEALEKSYASNIFVKWQVCNPLPQIS